MNDTTFDSVECSILASECVCHQVYQFYEWHEKLVLGLIGLPVICFGLGANLLSALIFSHRLMASSPLNWYLTVLSLSDSLVLLSAFFVLTLPRLGEFLMLWNSTSMSYLTTPYMYGMMMLAQTVSVWMTTGASVHRYIGVCLPFKASTLLRRRNVTSFLFSLVVFSILFNSTRFFEVRVINSCYRSNINAIMPVLAPTTLRLNSAYRLIFFGWAYTALMFVVPFSLLIFFNWQVLLAVRRQNRRHPVGGGADRAEKKERQTSVMLVAIVLLFLSCNTLAFVVNLLENLGLDSGVYISLVTYNNLLVMINASCNIFIYIFFSDKYRLLLQHYLSCDWSRNGELLIEHTY
ncbi:hypothetical protein QR680_003263 [Steinernema hermaphroditum]|uniref:G-protein coupled receptors family 1 profile domain-containing protein n=1 Tax=Steinernema hermaphroditum TaxID=289476 RepID=A0AA39H611_9BILA|nr:hypothetical protein QR680_003263 [Steinernema hermaphroditum]